MYVKPASLPVARPARDPLRTVAYCASTSARAAWAALVPAKRPEV